VCPPVHLRTLLVLQACMITWRKIFTCRQGAFLNIQVFRANVYNWTHASSPLASERALCLLCEWPHA